LYFNNKNDTIKHGETMKQYLERYLQDFPNGTIQDSLKYLFQTYGPRHLWMNNKVAECINQELATLTDLGKYENLYDQIGPCFVRINLRVFKKYHLDTKWLVATFINSNHYEQPQIDWQAFRQVLSEVGYLTKDVDSELAKLKASASISHSDEYHQAYHPAYRLVKKALLTEDIIFLQAKNFLDQYSDNKLKIIAIDGKCACGKTTLAQHLSEHYHAVVVHADDFFDNADQEIGINSQRFKEEILNRAVKGKALEYQRYDCAKKKMLSVKTDILQEWLIIEGVYAANTQLYDAYDAVLFMDIEPKEQLKRLGLRSQILLPRFQNEWIPRENTYFQREKLYLKADLII